MAINFSTQLYKHQQDTFGRPVVFTPLQSQPNGAPYTARGILEQEAIDVAGLDNSIISEMRIILDILDAEYSVMPLQGDLVDIPADVSGLPAEGQFEVIDSDQNGGGETTLTLRRMVQAKP
jgi:hypothetical protein